MDFSKQVSTSLSAKSRRIGVATAVLLSAASLVASSLAQAANTPDPTAVTIPGNLQESLGCPANWQPACLDTQLTLNETANVWKGTFDMSVGDYEYKVALNETWDENYGENAIRNGGNIKLFTSRSFWGALATGSPIA